VLLLLPLELREIERREEGEVYPVEGGLLDWDGE